MCSYAHQGQTYPQPTPDHHTRLLSWYWLDRASLLPPLLLKPLPGQTILDMCSAPGGKSLMLAYMLFAPKAFSPISGTASTATTATTAASHTARPHLSQAHAQSDPDANANNTCAVKSSASSRLQHDTLEGSTADALPQHNKLSSHTCGAAAASTPHKHEQTDGSLDEQTRTSTHHPPKSQACIHVRTDAIDLAEPNTLAELVAEPASTPATLSAQHGQHVALAGSLTCNELDAPRRSKLHSVLDAYLPAPLKRKVRYDSGTTLYQLPTAL